MNEGDEDFVFYGTPIEREEDMSRRKRKIGSEAGQMRNLPAWKQEVTDEEGRRRFHGAFTGGFSAGYYNTVGSKEGWTPQTFTSSRKNRAEMKKQSIYSFLDDDEKAEISGNGLETSSQFDTFGFTAAEIARKQAEKTQEMRPSAIPGPVPDEIVLPAANSIGVKLLLKMGWRHGHSIKSSHTGKLYDARREARKAFLALTGNNGTSETAEVEPDGVDSQDLLERQNGTPVFVLEPKKDLHGLGFDPFKNAPEFRERNASLVAGKKGLAAKRGLFATNSGKIAPGFGIGALEESGIEDEDVYASEFEFEEPYVEEPEQTVKVNQDAKLRLTDKERNVLVGFKVASGADYVIERFPPPAIPSDFRPYHKFTVSFQASVKPGDLPPPPEAPAPDEKDLKILIDGFASLVSRCGKIYEDLSKEKHKGNPLFSFLYGGNGHDYYIRKLWEEQQKRPDLRPMLKQATSVQKLTAETRGRILGEKPLKRSDDGAKPAVQLQYHLADSFTVPSTLAGIPESEKPFRDDPMKQARFEQFLKDKYQGGLRSTSAASGASAMSEEDRARERLDFEATAEALSKGKAPTVPSALPPPVAAVHFVSGGREEAAVVVVEKKTNYPKREEFQWRPAPVLCKRFDLVDPFMGKLPPPPRARSKVETLIIMPEILKSKFEEAAADVSGDAPSASQTDVPELDSLPQAAVAERRVDLYKAIFSDDEEEDINEEEETLNPTNPSSSSTEPASETTNSTLNKLIAGDFLQTLGQELGLQVLPDSQPPVFSSRKPSKLGDSSKRKSREKSTSSKERRKSSRDRSDSESESGRESESRRKRKSRERRKRSRSRERRSDGHGSRSRSRRRHH